MTDREKPRLFDDWPDRYEKWFLTPIGALAKRAEWEAIRELLQPGPGQFILDAGCGSGIFTLDLLSCGARVMGLDLSLPMIRRAKQKAGQSSLRLLLGDILNLPFPENAFDKTVSITALEFIFDARRAIQELVRVTRKGGLVVVATLNRLSPWAQRRQEEGRKGHPLFSKAIFRSPEDLLCLGPPDGVFRTAVHFAKEDPPELAAEREEQGRRKGLSTGAFLAARWIKR